MIYIHINWTTQAIYYFHFFFFLKLEQKLEFCLADFVWPQSIPFSQSDTWEYFFIDIAQLQKEIIGANCAQFVRDHLSAQFMYVTQFCILNILHFLDSHVPCMYVGGGGGGNG